jgi:hypothetical protein
MALASSLTAPDFFLPSFSTLLAEQWNLLARGFGAPVPRSNAFTQVKPENIYIFFKKHDSSNIFFWDST